MLLELQSMTCAINGVFTSYPSTVTSSLESEFVSLQVEKAHDADLHCVDWNPYDVNLILTG